MSNIIDRGDERRQNRYRGTAKNHDTGYNGAGYENEKENRHPDNPGRDGV